MKPPCAVHAIWCRSLRGLDGGAWAVGCSSHVPPEPLTQTAASLLHWHPGSLLTQNHTPNRICIFVSHTKLSLMSVEMLLASTIIIISGFTNHRLYAKIFSLRLSGWWKMKVTSPHCVWHFLWKHHQLFWCHTLFFSISCLFKTTFIKENNTWSYIGVIRTTKSERNHLCRNNIGSVTLLHGGSGMHHAFCNQPPGVQTLEFNSKYQAGN